MIDDKDIEKLSEVFATKEDLKNLGEVFATKEDFNKIMDGQDEIVGKLNLLLEEKTIGDAQDKRQKKVLEIHNNALKKNKILSENEVSEIDKLRIF